MNWHIGCAAFLIMLALCGCIQGGQTRPYSPESDRNMPEHGGGDGGGGGGM
jgi:hypothetical protein